MKLSTFLSIASLISLAKAKYEDGHTMYEYEEQACPDKQLKRFGVNNKDIREILNVHNTLRNKVATGETDQPNASNIFEMVWDEELSIIAERWAEQCVFEHDKLRNTERYKTVGQNIAIQSFSKDENDTADFLHAIQMWFNEINSCHADVSKYQKNDETGHYTQLVWASSDRIGCGYTYFCDKYEEFSFSKLYVCNYGPGGNVLGMPVYLEGDAASKCPGKKSKTYSGLCGTPP